MYLKMVFYSLSGGVSDSLFDTGGHGQSKLEVD